ncbi:hypothetical protein [Symmachiella dynata]|uniref:hypothetical protein n=1 Tax=Symmachiella dynata TaxID=2527995 RepID=UPI0011A387F4|nr:hypothetical protein [Symmachiella dynata]
MKLSVCIVAGSMLPAGLVVSWGRHNDKREAPGLLSKVRHVTQPNGLLLTQVMMPSESTCIVVTIGM